MTTFTLPRIDQADEADTPLGFGSLKTDIGNMPLKQLGYHTRVVGMGAATTIKQTFYNPFDECIEATYIFPIEGDQAVVGCEIWVADRLVRAQLKERGQARSDYRRAIHDGYRAALLEQNRGETFSMKVGNIPPGEAIQVRIETIGNLTVAHGEWTLRLPLVVAPRYTSGFPMPGRSVGSGVAADTDQVPDASTVTPPTWLPGFPSPVDLSLSVDIDLGALSDAPDWPTRLRSSLHAVAVQTQSDDGGTARSASLRIQPGEKVDRDFILRGSLNTSQTTASLMHDESNATFAVQVSPPAKASSSPRDIVFLLDRSGSMSGWKMDAARRGISRLIDTLSPQDRFQVLAFDNRIETPLAGTPIQLQPATDANRYRAVRWLAKIEARGGTEMGWAMEQAIQPFASPSNEFDSNPRSAALVLVTDGQITGEDSVLRLLGQIPKQRCPRIYCLGVDRAVNGGVLKRLTKFTNGTYELVESEKRLDEILQRFGLEMGSPSITDLRFEAIDGDISQLTPNGQDVLYSGRPVSFYGRTTGSGSPRIAIHGTQTNGQPWSQILDPMPVTTGGNETSVLHSLWGRARLRELEDQFAASAAPDRLLQNAITRCSLETNVLSRFTAFVAVDDTERVNANRHPHSITQPVESPEGWQSSAAAPIARNRLVAFPKPATVRQPSTGSYVSKGPSTSGFALPKQFDDLIVQKGIVSLDQFSEAEALAKSTATNVGNALVRLQYATSEEVARVTAESFKMPYVNLRHTSIPLNVVELIPESVARENGVMPLSQSGNSLTVLISNPSDLETIEKLRFILNRNIQVMVASPEAIMQSINLHYGQVEGESADSMLQEFTDTAIDFTETADDDDMMDGDSDACFGLADDIVAGRLQSDDEVYGMIQPTNDWIEPPMRKRRASQPKPAPQLNDSPVIRLVNLLIAEAIQLRATHVILSPRTEAVVVHYVVDGVAVERERIPRRMLAAIISRLKILSNVDIAIQDQLQSGTMKLTVGDKSTVSQVHFAPTQEGTKVLIELGVEGQPSPDATVPDSVREWWDPVTPLQ
ncbi:Type II secretion system protein E [Rubripirellula tenax]|uniref:Type II secretion system protein E n=1 Tax=Rubripirellula tenax TaxID=2528015 RepID=A0A5C6F5U4_9BACT|nr:ATPase, T2SS/T4P/T4SS family [Rubripirellula tenax]TWU56718.1 Type II secretion system protein E [Rubripirellula tenax]